jgi:hypothetical protein
MASSKPPLHVHRGAARICAGSTAVKIVRTGVRRFRPPVYCGMRRPQPLFAGFWASVRQGAGQFPGPWFPPMECRKSSRRRRKRVGSIISTTCRWSAGRGPTADRGRAPHHSSAMPAHPIIGTFRAPGTTLVEKLRMSLLRQGSGPRFLRRPCQSMTGPDCRGAAGAFPSIRCGGTSPQPPARGQGDRAECDRLLVIGAPNSGNSLLAEVSAPARLINAPPISTGTRNAEWEFSRGFRARSIGPRSCRCAWRAIRGYGRDRRA